MTGGNIFMELSGCPDRECFVENANRKIRKKKRMGCAGTVTSCSPLLSPLWLGREGLVGNPQ